VELTLSARHGRDCTVVCACGVLDLATAPQLQELLQQLLDDGAARVVIDLGGVRLIDSSALGTLVLMFKAFQEHGAGLCLAAVQPLVGKVLALTSVDQVIEVYDSVSAAEHSTGQPPPPDGVQPR
jgi:anti-sigma B factor antagonist